MFRIEHNVETGEITEIPVTQKEIDALKAAPVVLTDEMKEAKAEAEAKATAKASALAKLEALGLSADEIAAL